VGNYYSVPGRMILAGFLVLLAALPAHGQDISWHHDYRTAYEESRAGGRPLLIDFGTDPCVWCKRLDATTFRDPAVVGLVRNGFVALRVDARYEPGLVRALHIQSFPTVVLAGPNGAILDRLVGYAPAARFQLHLRQILAQLSDSDRVVRDYRDAEAALAVPDYPRAIALLKQVLADGGNRPVQFQARALWQELEQQAADRLRWGRELQQKGQLAESGAVLGDLARTYEGTEAARQAGEMLLAARPR